jgi:hypothetical protein
VGAVPLTRNCLTSDQVRHEIVVAADGTVDADADPQTSLFLQLESCNKLCFDLLSASGFDGGKLRAEAPKLSQNGHDSITKPRAKSAGHHFHATGGDTLNGDDLFIALKRKGNEETIGKLEAERAKRNAMMNFEQTAKAKMGDFAVEENGVEGLTTAHWEGT